MTAAYPLLEELSRTEETYSRALRELDGFLRETVAVRTRGEELAARLDAAPTEQARLAEVLSDAEADARASREALAAAEAELAAAEGRRSVERLAAARGARERAADEVALAERRADACRSALERHELEIDALRREAPEVEHRAAELAAGLKGRPRIAAEAAELPPTGLAGVVEWAGAARAALLVARAGIVAEHEAVIRQANELASSVLGEPLAASSVADIARRLERVARG